MGISIEPEMTDQTYHLPHNPYCPHFQRLIELVGRRWTGTILRALLAGDARFTEIARTVPGLSNRLLAERLEELKKAGLVSVHSNAKRGTYHLTDRGEDLRSIFAEIEVWNARWYEADRRETESVDS
jgi:DNA-binding HxlR family transcriptional regulator